MQAVFTPPLRGVSDRNTIAAVFTAEIGLQLLHTLASCRMNSDDLRVAMKLISDFCATTSSASFHCWEILFSRHETSVHAHLRCLTNYRNGQLVLHVFQEDTVANVIVSHGKSILGIVVWALPRFLFALLFYLRRNANLAGGFVGRFGFGRFYVFEFS